MIAEAIKLLHAEGLPDTHNPANFLRQAEAALILCQAIIEIPA